MVKKIKFVIDENGEVTIDVDGVQGSSCEELTKPFEEILGSTASRELKDSYYQESEESNIQSSETD